MGETKVRVLFLIGGLAIGEHWGGQERLGVELATRLEPARFETHICALWQHGLPSEREWEDVLQRAGIPFFYAGDFGSGITLPHFLTGVRRIQEHYREMRFDLGHAMLPLAGLALLLARRRIGVARVVRTSGAGKEWGNGLAATLFRQIFTNWVYPMSFDAETCVSRSLADRFDARPGARLSGKKAFRVYNSIPVEQFATALSVRTATRTTLNVAADELLVGTVGRLAREKDHAGFIEAAARVRASYPGVRFLIVGDGPLRERLHRQAESLSLRDALIFTGARRDTPSLYRAMDLFVLPSRWEGLPTVILEAMASGVPVLATDLPGTRELIDPGRTGWLVPAGNPEALACAIVTALRSPEDLRRFPETARREVVPRFEMEQMVAEYEKLYTALRTKDD